jgi:hypothetical protein
VLLRAQMLKCLYFPHRLAIGSARPKWLIAAASGFPRSFRQTQHSELIDRFPLVRSALKTRWQATSSINRAQ